MNIPVILFGSIVLALGAPAQPSSQPVPAKPAEPAKETTFNFDKDAANKLPDGWKAEGTNQKGPAATWEVAADKTAPSAPNVLALSKTNHDSGGTFNICWTDKVRFTDGAIEVKFRANSGKEDQGGGLIWRVKDKDNYMVARMNPLEDNFRVYYVKDGSRHQIESAKVNVETGTWHTMKIEQHGDHVVCSLDGKEYLNSKDDHIGAEGGVGLWTKADAASSFDDLTIKPGGADSNATKPGDKKPADKGKKDKNDDDDDDKK
jgi:hypothetical protein